MQHIMEKDMKYLTIAFFSLVTINIANASSISENDMNPIIKDMVSKDTIIVAGTCFKSGEQKSGMNKICYYDCVGGTSAITIKSYELCPLTIND